MGSSSLEAPHEEEFEREIAGFELETFVLEYGTVEQVERVLTMTGGTLEQGRRVFTKLSQSPTYLTQTYIKLLRASPHSTHLVEPSAVQDGSCLPDAAAAECNDRLAVLQQAEASSDASGKFGWTRGAESKPVKTNAKVMAMLDEVDQKTISIPELTLHQAAMQDYLSLLVSAIHTLPQLTDHAPTSAMEEEQTLQATLVAMSCRFILHLINYSAQVSLQSSSSLCRLSDPFASFV